MPPEFRNLAPDEWEIRPGTGPVLATAVHAGHLLRPEVAAHTALSDAERLREEDPMTDVLASVGDSVFITRTSRFEVDLNRPTDEAVYRVPGDAWGLDVWKEDLDDAIVERSLDQHARFYDAMGAWIEALIAEYGSILLLDVHSFNHRPEDEDRQDLSDDGLPDIDLGLSTADRDRFGSVVDALRSELADIHLGDHQVTVGENERFPDGGNWPEWVYANYGEHVCTVTLEYKKMFMDEWSGQADIRRLLGLHTGLAHATRSARAAIS